MSRNGNGSGFHSNGNGIHTGRPWSFWKRRAEPKEADSFRRIALQLHYDTIGRGPRSVLVSTPEATQMCARTCLGLAHSLADELNRPVALVDASQEPLSTTELLKSSLPSGFCDLLANPETDLDSVMLPTTCTNLVVIPRGTVLTRCPDSSVIGPVVQRLCSRFDFTVIAGGAALGDSLTRALAAHVGRVLLLGIENETLVDDLDAAQYALANGESAKIALVLVQRGS